MRLAAAVVLTIALISSCTPAEIPETSSQHAQRIVTLAPNLTELVFAAGAGDLLVGVSAWSDFPADALALPVISDAFTVDQEQLTLLRPDLLLAWKSGTPTHVIDELRAAGFNVEAIETRGLDDVADALLRIGALSGRIPAATAAASDYREALAALADRYAEVAEISVFYQISARPLYTINSEHFISEILSICGGDNIFAELGTLAPSVSVEAVIDRNPEVLLAPSGDGELPFDDWQRWDGLAANRLGNHFVVSADEIARATPRLVTAASQVCAVLDTARTNRQAHDG